MPKQAKSKAALPSDKLLPRVTMFFFRHARTTALIWLALTLFGALSYTSFLRREGFPSVNIPLAVVNGAYFVNDPAKVDNDVAKPLSELVLKQENVNSVQAQSAANFFNLTIQYKEGTDAKAAAQKLKQAVDSSNSLPKTVRLQYSVPYFGPTGGDTKKIDVAVSFYNTTGKADAQTNAFMGRRATEWLKVQKIPHVTDISLKNPFDIATDPATGEQVAAQKSFDRFGIRQDNNNNYYNSVIIGITADNDVDVLQLDKDVSAALRKLEDQGQFRDYKAEISASFAPQIKDNIGELQRVLLEGLLAVLIVGSIVIAIRASLITVISMITVLLITLGLLFVIGYTLNVITLFALILALALIVDDTIIMVEAIDAARHHNKDPNKAVLEASRKVSRAMVAATATAALSFMPLLFVGGVLGSFIRAIPVTIIAALVISLFVALIFIPLFARYILLGKKQMGAKGVKEVAAGFENKIGDFVTKPMVWARGSRKRLFGVGLSAVTVGLAFFIGGMILAQNVVFNIFPPTKDTNGIILNMNFPPAIPISQAEAIAANADKLASSVIGSNFESASYYGTGSAQDATETIHIISYNKRSVTSPQLVRELQQKFDNDFKEAKVTVAQVDVGPPSAPFVVQIDANNREAAYKLASDMSQFLANAELKRPNGSVSHLKNVSVSDQDQFIRSKGQPIITVSASFDSNDTTTLVNLAQKAINERYNAEKIKSFGLQEGAVTFNLGQESENQDSFKTLALAFPIMLLVMYILLAVQFRSFLQPLLIFMAVPFSIFGIMLGLDITNNAISFFAMLGFFALVGLSIKNTILLTDFANQAHKQGADPIEAATAALHERFRPLFATSVTAVVSLIPLAIASPFWEGLAVVLIFGLISSTLLVVTIFPYYYLGAEYLRIKVPPMIFGNKKSHTKNIRTGGNPKKRTAKKAVKTNPKTKKSNKNKT